MNNNNKTITPLMRRKAAQSLPIQSTVQLRKLIRNEIARNEEPKHFDVLNSGTAGIAGSGVLYLSSMAQGSTDITRIGDQINLKSLQFRFDSIYADNTNFMRLIIFQWVGDAVTDVPTINAVLESTPYYLSPYNWDQRRKFRILHETWKLDAVTSPRTHLGKGSVGLPIKTQQFLNASTNIEAGGLFAVFCSDSAAAAHPAYDLYTRVHYTDA